jgi:hypothetical protein
MILSNRLFNNLKQTQLRPILVLQIDGVPFLIGSDTIKKIPLYGDDNLEYGQPGLFYGGLFDIEPDKQKTLISLEGTTTQIRQSLEPDKARGSGISQMTISLIDKNQEATKLLAGAYGEVLFKKCKLWVSFGEDNVFNTDYILIFRGVIESVSAEQGRCKLFLNSPDQKKRSQLFIKPDTDLDGAINNVQTTLTVSEIENFFVVPDHPAYSPKDTSLTTCVRIDDEIIKYEGISGNNLTGLTRGFLGTTAASHNDEAQVEGFLVLEGNAIDLALKIMLSDKDQTPYIEDLPATNVGTDGTNVLDNAIFFTDVNFNRDFQIEIGDFVKTSGFTNPANNLSLWTKILDFGITNQGSYIVVDASLVFEPTTSGTVDFLSQYNTFGSFGLGMDTDEVDIDKHLFLKGSFLSEYQMRFFLRDDIESGKEFIEKELYLPTSCYSLPTDAEGLSRVSIGIHKPPIPGTNIITASKRNITNPQSLNVQRSVNKNYYSAIVTKYEDKPLDEELRRRSITVVGTSQIPSAGNKTLLIEARGFRSVFNAKFLAEQTQNRLLQRYSGAAESIQGAQVHFRDAVQVVPGDVIVFDPEGLNLIDNESQSRKKPPLLMEVVNRTIDIKNGSASFELVASGFNIDARFGLVSPSSKIVNVTGPKTFVITFIYVASPYGPSEFRKWNRLINPAVRIRRPDFSQVFNTVLVSANSNTVEIRDVPPFSLQPNDIMEFSDYSFVDTKQQQKLIYAFATDDENDFPDGGKYYGLI